MSQHSAPGKHVDGLLLQVGFGGGEGGPMTAPPVQLIVFRLSLSPIHSKSEATAYIYIGNAIN